MSQPEPDRKIRAVVLDMDGTMFNTEDLYNIVGEQMLAPRGHEFTLELKHKMMGLPGTKAFDVMIEHCNLDDSAETLRQECDELFMALEDRIETMPGLDWLLGRIEEIGLPKAVATSSHRQFADHALGKFDLLERFEFVLAGGDVENGKPHPDIYIEAARRLSVEPAEMLVLEDSFTGSTAAAASGALTIAVPTHHSLCRDFSHADHVASSLDDAIIRALLDQAA
ncbi:MAG: HAD family phosphatase [Planctomycetota bacterium]